LLSRVSEHHCENFFVRFSGWSTYNNLFSIVLRRVIYCSLISIFPRWSQATYFNSSSDTKLTKNYGQIKSVLNNALQFYAKKGSKFTKGGERVKNGKHIFMHHTKFLCVKQLPGSVKEAFYALHHMKGIMRDSRIRALPANL
jgi:hypothetical protein